MRAPICPSHAMFLFAASRFNLLVRARTPRSEIILLRRGNANSHAPSDIHNTTPLIPHCLRVPSTPLPPPPPLFLLVNYFPSSRRPPLLPSFLDGEKNSRGESLSTVFFFFHEEVKLDPRYAILVVWRMILANRKARVATFSGIHAVTHRHAVRPREHLQSVGSGVRWVRNTANCRSTVSIHVVLTT